MSAVCHPAVCHRFSAATFERAASVFVVLLACLAGCSGESNREGTKAATGAGNSNSAEFAQPAAEQPGQPTAEQAGQPAAPIRLYSLSGVETDWADSADGAFSMRIGTGIAPGDGPIRMWAALRNNTEQPQRVIQAFGDKYYAASGGLKIDGPRGRCAYVGKTPGYDLGEDSYITINPGEYAYDRFEIDPALFSNYGERGAYDITYRYVTATGSETVCGPVRTYLGRDRDDAGDGSLEKLLSFEFSRTPYRFSSAEAAGGVTFEYALVVRERTPPLVVIPRSPHTGDNRSDGDIPVFEVLSGNGHGYALYDCGPGAPEPSRPAQPLAKARHEYTMQWDGRNWSGPSDTTMPKGPPFPPGEYKLAVSLWGIVESADGPRYFKVEAAAPVEITP